VTQRARWLIALGILLVGIVVALAWPPGDPLAEARTVALRTDPGAGVPAAIDVQSELTVVLNQRDLRIVSDETDADVVLAVTDVRFDLGTAQVALQGGRLTGRATAVCRVVDVKTQRVYVMDLVLRLRDGRVSASLTGRRFWELWKPRPTL